MNALTSITAVSAAFLSLIVQSTAKDMTSRFKAKHPEFSGHKIHLQVHFSKFFSLLLLICPILNTMLLIYIVAEYDKVYSHVANQLETAFREGLVFPG